MISKWMNSDKSEVAIKAEMADGTVQQMKVNRKNPDGTENSIFLEVLRHHSIQDIDKNTDELRKERSLNDMDQRRKHEQDKKNHNQQKYIQKLFEAKLEVFEIPEIKESENRSLRSKIRRSKSVAEVYTNAAIAIISNKYELHEKRA